MVSRFREGSRTYECHVQCPGGPGAAPSVGYGFLRTSASAASSSWSTVAQN